MEQSSLEIYMKKIIEKISVTDTPLADRCEAMNNLVYFLQNYEEHLKVLQNYDSNKKKALKYKLDKPEE